MICRIVLVVLAAVVTGWNTAQPKERPELLTRAGPAVVKIVVEGKGPSGKRRTPMRGSGFFVLSQAADNFSVVATAAHVLGRPGEWQMGPNERRVREIWIEQQGRNGIVSRLPKPASVLIEDHEHDVALLAIDGANFATLTLGQPFNDLKLGESGLLVGYAANDSVVTSRAGARDQAELGQFGLALRLNFVALPGHSGGPVLAPNGKVVGVASYNHPKDRPQYHLAILSSLIIHYLGTIAPPFSFSSEFWRSKPVDQWIQEQKGAIQ